jgi:hypothetical protein
VTSKDVCEKQKDEAERKSSGKMKYPAKLFFIEMADQNGSLKY